MKGDACEKKHGWINDSDWGEQFTVNSPFTKMCTFLQRHIFCHIMNLYKLSKRIKHAFLKIPLVFVINKHGK